MGIAFLVIESKLVRGSLGVKVDACLVTWAVRLEFEELLVQARVVTDLPLLVSGLPVKNC
jgi:hypothetical protein